MTRRPSPDLEATTRLRLERLLASDVGASGGEPAREAEAQPPAGTVSLGVSTVIDRLPEGLRTALVALERPAVAGLALLGVVAVLAAMVVWGIGRPRAVSVAPLPLSSGSATGPLAAPARATPTASSVVVDVTGLVRRPGVVSLAAGSRVADALAAAGGAKADADLALVNLARRVADGEQIVVRPTGAPPAPGAPDLGGVGAGGAGSGGADSGSAPAPGVSGPLDLNTVTLQQLDGLPGVGPVLAQRILDWRTAHGRFATVDELHEVTGIGNSRFNDLKSLVTV